MELSFRSNIKGWLDNLESQKPIPTDFCPILKCDFPVKAVIFDIYGTLLISSSGDIDQAVLSEENMAEALQAGEIDLDNSDPSAPQFLLEQLSVKIASNQEELKQKGHPYPDVDIVKVWKEMLDAAEKNRLLILTGKESVADIIMVFELLSNRVYPMPGMKEILQKLIEKGIPIGIVSNAQFYTPIIMNYFLSGDFSSSQEIGIFDPDLCVYSYRELRAKPDTMLFTKIIRNLDRKYNIKPGEALFVGNDMLKDIFTAKKSGLRTALFSGDKRSLRIREGDSRVKGIFPDFFINDLRQILDII